VDSVVGEVEHLADEGVVELNLIAQDMSGYGMDWGRRGELIHLLKRLVKISGIRWIRLLYLYPHRFPEGLMELMASEEKICKYVDLPLQHIDDDILHRMNRGGNSHEIRTLLDKLQKNIPGLTLRTTFIVGFPGETEKQHQGLYEFVREARFDRVGVFTYSPEEGTAAYPLRDTASEATKQRRRDRLMKLQAKISMKKNSALIGTIQNVLVDGVSSETDLLLEGRTAGHAPEIDGRVYINEGTARPGDFVQVEITQASHYDLVGRIIPRSEFTLKNVPDARRRENRTGTYDICT
jgi:ribosomal protein S12 methylthiotransferase